MTDILLAAAPLNQGQQAAAEGFFQWLFSTDKELIISGPGGVGKTHLMSNLIDTVMPRYFQTCQLMAIDPEYDEVVMCATTNKAAEVLAESTKRPVDTIHSFLNLKVQENFETGEVKLKPTTAWRVHDRKIIFIDECSMIDKDLLEYIYTGTHKCKIVYVGDHCQLAPVKEPISPIYRSEKPFYELTEQMRNASQPALMNLCNQLRNTVETGEFKPIQIVPGVIDLLDDTQMQAELDRHFISQTHSSRILAYTNRRVMEYNDYIRQIRQLPPTYTAGEYLVNNTAIRLKDRMLSVEEEVTVDAISDSSYMVPLPGDAEMEVRDATITSRIGDTFSVHLPVDRPHFQALLKWYAHRKDWHTYFAMKQKYPDLRQRDAATVHKSQGSTYDSVFIDLSNISTCHNPGQVARMLYVAVSRPRSRIFLYGQLAEKYGGISVALQGH